MVELGEGTMKSWRSLSAVALSAIVLASGLSRWTASSPAPPPYPGPNSTARAVRSADLKAARVPIPSVNLHAIARGDRLAAPARLPRPAAESAAGDHAWVTAAAELAAPDGSTGQRLPPPAPPADAPSGVSELMVCHLDSRGPYGAADALQECISRAPAYSSIEIPPGTYVLHRQVIVSTPLTIRTAGSGGTPLSCAADPAPCAVLVAAPDLLAMWGPLVVWSTNNVSLEHLVIDGNRSARAASIAAGFCLTRSNTFGFNASVLDCSDCTLDDVVSAHALCGTGMVWSGARATIQRSAFVANGDAARQMWSDGLTLISAPESLVRANQFVDNSDVALLIAYGVRARVEDNVVVQRTQPSFAGLMLHNFNANVRTSGDFRGAVFAGNTVDCGALLCAFGIQGGPRPWNMKGIIVGGDLHDNAVRGAKVGINVDGAGVFSAPVAIYDNRVTPAPAGSYFSGCAQPISADWMNVAPASVVDRRDETARTSSHLSDWCQLWSGLSSDE